MDTRSRSLIFVFISVCLNFFANGTMANETFTAFKGVRSDLHFTVAHKFTDAIITDNACFAFGDPLFLHANQQAHIKLPMTAQCSGTLTLPTLTLISNDEIQHISNRFIIVDEAADRTSVQLKERLSHTQIYPNQQLTAEYVIDVHTNPFSLSNLAITLPLLEHENVTVTPVSPTGENVLGLWVNGKRHFAQWQKTEQGLQLRFQFHIRPHRAGTLTVGQPYLTYHRNLHPSASVTTSLATYGADFDNHFVEQTALSANNILGLAATNTPAIHVKEINIPSESYAFVGQPTVSASVEAPSIALNQATTVTLTVQHPDAATYTFFDLRDMPDMLADFSIVSAPYDPTINTDLHGQSNLSWKQDIYLKNTQASTIPRLTVPYLSLPDETVKQAHSAPIAITVKSSQRFQLSHFVNIDLDTLKAPVEINKEGMWSSDWHTIYIDNAPHWLNQYRFYIIATGLFLLSLIRPFYQATLAYRQHHPVMVFRRDLQRYDPHLALCRYITRKTGQHAYTHAALHHVFQTLSIPINTQQQVMQCIHTIEARKHNGQPFQQECQTLIALIRRIDRHIKAHMEKRA